MLTEPLNFKPISSQPERCKSTSYNLHVDSPFRQKLCRYGVLSGAVISCKIAARTFPLGEGKPFPRLSQAVHSFVTSKCFPNPLKENPTNLGKALLFKDTTLTAFSEGTNKFTLKKELGKER